MLRDLLAEFAARGAEGRVSKCIQGKRWATDTPRTRSIHRAPHPTIHMQMAAKQAFIQELKALPIAVETQAANDQHYQSIPTEFYKLVLGPCMKYSCGLWPEPTTTFEESERAMLELYCERAELRDGMKVSGRSSAWVGWVAMVGTEGSMI